MNLRPEEDVESSLAYRAQHVSVPSLCVRGVGTGALEAHAC